MFTRNIWGQHNEERNKIICYFDLQLFLFSRSIQCIRFLCIEPAGSPEKMQTVSLSLLQASLPLPRLTGPRPLNCPPPSSRTLGAPCPIRIYSPTDTHQSCSHTHCAIRQKVHRAAPYPVMCSLSLDLSIFNRIECLLMFLFPGSFWAVPCNASSCLTWTWTCRIWRTVRIRICMLRLRGIEILKYFSLKGKETQ